MAISLCNKIYKYFVIKKFVIIIYEFFNIKYAHLLEKQPQLVRPICVGCGLKECQIVGAPK